jgi:hypothetical protein
MKKVITFCFTPFKGKAGCQNRIESVQRALFFVVHAFISQREFGQSLVNE